MAVQLTVEERDWLEGRAGGALRRAMRIVVAVADAQGARRLRPVTRAHIDSCLYHGRVSVDFAEQFVELGGRVAVPTTLNVGSLDLLHPGTVRAEEAFVHGARRLMRAYQALGGRPTWTCAPYQLPDARPSFGDHVAWGESNAVAFANSALGARTNRYTDFLDVAAAITARVPDTGLHLDANRRATIVFDVSAIAGDLSSDNVWWAVLGHLVGGICGTGVPALVGVGSPVGEDALKAFAAAAASSGAVALFHVVGVTPEAPRLASVADGSLQPVTVGRDDLHRARDDLNTAPPDVVDAISVGTPHASPAELRALADALGGRSVSCPLYVSTSRAALGASACADKLRDAGVTVVVDTCTYITPILREARIVMTNSAKWAYYAPGNLNVGVVFGGLSECVETAVDGGRVRLGRR